MRTFLWVVTIVMLGTAATARADGVGLGLFVGRPTGLTVKIDLQRSSALDLVAGVTAYNDEQRGYAHLTYQVAPFVAKGRTVLVPFRLGIGAALYGASGDVNLAARAPVGLALQFRRSPLELYGEVAVRVVLVDDHRDEDKVQVDGGGGFRIYF